MFVLPFYIFPYLFFFFSFLLSLLLHFLHAFLCIFFFLLNLFLLSSLPLSFSPFYLFYLSFFKFLFSLSPGQYENRLHKYIRHYEGLSYDTNDLHSKHQRAKRALSHEDKFVHLEFHAHGRSVFSLPRCTSATMSKCDWCTSGHCHCVDPTIAPKSSYNNRLY